jgi:hypothetical protein
MKINLSFAELHNPLFLAGTNWGQKLVPNMGAKGKLELVYDRTEKELLVKTKGKVAIVPCASVASMTPVDIHKDISMDKEVAQTMDVVASPVIPPMLAKGKPGPKPKVNPVNAQVSGPHDHVFAGQGVGKVND